jgi:hypothetical protein
MTHRAWVWRVLAAHGGWNARSRRALATWARQQGIAPQELRSLVERAVRGAPASWRTTPQACEEPLPPPRRSTRRTVLRSIAAATAGSVLSLLLLVELIRRAPQEAGPRPREAEPVMPTATPPQEVVRTLPPPPVSFPATPSLADAASQDGEGVESLGDRPEGDLSRADVAAWTKAMQRGMDIWPRMDDDRRHALAQSVADWFAATRDAGTLLRLQQAWQELEEERSDPAAALLARGWRHAVESLVRRSEGLSPVAAEAGFTDGSDSAIGMASWAMDEIPDLATQLLSAEGRQPWRAWIMAVATLPDAADRQACALAAIDAILKSPARLDGQGLAADALGSLLMALPVQPAQSGFEGVRRRWITWLDDPAVPSARLWALGGVWRSLPTAPDPWLLPGERDAMAVRRSVAERWESVQGGVAQDPADRLRGPLEQGMERGGSTWPESISAQVHLLRQAQALRSGMDPDQVRAASHAEAEESDADLLDGRWAAGLSSDQPGERLITLESMRDTVVTGLGERDAAALLRCALSGASPNERSLATDVMRGPPGRSPWMARVLAGEMALATHGREALDAIELVAGCMVPSGDGPEARAAVLRLLLAAGWHGDANPAARLQAELSAWAAAEGLRVSGPDPSAVSWELADARLRQVQALVVPAPVQPLVEEAERRLRAGERLLHAGPRGMAMSWRGLLGLQAAWLSVQCPVQAERLAEIVQEALGRPASDAWEQAALAVRALAVMELVCSGRSVKAFVTGGADASAEPAARQAEAGECLLLAAGVSGAPRERLLERAAMRGGGAMLPSSGAGPDPTRGVALTQALGWCRRGEWDRLLKGRSGKELKASLEWFAAEQGTTVPEWVEALQRADASERSRLLGRLHLAAWAALDPAAAAWPAADQFPQQVVP